MRKQENAALTSGVAALWRKLITFRQVLQLLMQQNGMQNLNNWRVRAFGKGQAADGRCVCTTENAEGGQGRPGRVPEGAAAMRVRGGGKT